MNFIDEICTTKNLTKVVCSNPFVKGKYQKITLRTVLSHGAQLFQAEKLTATQAFHENIAAQSLAEWLKSNVDGMYKQVCLFCRTKT